MDGSVHNRTNLKKVTQAYFCQEKRASPWSREGVWRSVHRFSTQPHKPCERHPGSEGQYTDEPLKTALIQNPIQYTSWKASSDKIQSTISQKRRREQWLNGSTQIIEAQLVYCIGGCCDDANIIINNWPFNLCTVLVGIAMMQHRCN